METIAVIGKNFGDEGKGLAVSVLSRDRKSLVIKHNGGAQAGHTVEGFNKDNISDRIVFHELGSGTVYGADTLWTNTYHPDLYKLRDEYELVLEKTNIEPIIFSEKDALITTLDDVLLNMGAESARGSKRHGSCGMGINECCERCLKGCKLTVFDIYSHNEDWIFEKLKDFRKKYSFNRASDLLIDEESEYFRILQDDDMLFNYVSEIKKNSELVRIIDADNSFLENYERLIFESGQGLLLDNDYDEYAPYLTPSKTGLTNPIAFLRSRGLELDEAIYVTRSYVTRHGNGFLPCECDKDELSKNIVDLTNEPNEWQGRIRYAKHESLEHFWKPVLNDCDSANFKGAISVLVTHLNETNGKLVFKDCDMELLEVIAGFEKKVKLYVSYDKINFN